MRLPRNTLTLWPARRKAQKPARTDKPSKSMTSLFEQAILREFDEAMREHGVRDRQKGR
jgi:hypothetical protein